VDQVIITEDLVEIKVDMEVMEDMIIMVVMVAMVAIIKVDSVETNVDTAIMAVMVVMDIIDRNTITYYFKPCLLLFVEYSYVLRVEITALHLIAILMYPFDQYLR
jgi:hypothetical protein